jgi:hypothetical protein
MAMKLKHFLVCAGLSISLVIPARLNGQSDGSGYGSLVNFQLDNCGQRWTLMTIGGYFRPILKTNKCEFLQLGGSFSLLDLYKGRHIPSVIYDSTFVDRYGYALAVFPISARLSLASWPVGKKLFGITYLYFDYWWIMRGSFLPATGPGEQNHDAESPDPKMFIETGIGFSPIGALVTIKLFYRHLVIPADEGTDVLPSTVYYNSSRLIPWVFDGYNKPSFGLSIMFNIGKEKY